MDIYRRELLGLPLREQVLKLETYYERFFIAALDTKYDPDRIFQMIGHAQDIRGTLDAFSYTWPANGLKHLDGVNRSTRDNAYETVTSSDVFAKKDKRN